MHKSCNFIVDHERIITSSPSNSERSIHLNRPLSLKLLQTNKQIQI